MVPNQLVDSRDIRFVLFEMLEIDALCKCDAFSAFDRDVFEEVLDLAEKMAHEQVYPANAEGDRAGVDFDPETGLVRVPVAFRPAMALFNEAGFPGLASDPAWGGAGMPEAVYRAVMEYFFAAGIAFTMHVSLSVGAANLVKNFAPEGIRDLYLGHMVSGRWGGTMCLTEPGAGSDVGALKTKAVKKDDGTYLITGQKIFISSGDNDLYENIVHPVLARIEGDPPGTKGISIFLVPKFFANPDGSLGKRNDVVCSGVEHKMGIRGSATCTLNFGDNGGCTGFLMGQERQGMKIMFQMMNEARLDVALQGLAVSSSAYMHAAAYSKGRLQGSDPGTKGQVPIIRHPDVRRMLLWMKSSVEAMRMITCLAAHSVDIAHAVDGESAREAKALLDILIPVCKAGNTDLAWQVTGEAVQVYGGYGYCADYPVEQLARDSKILSIYEGTNGIQSIDLVMRKLLLDPDKYNYQVLKKRMLSTIESARSAVEGKYVEPLEKGITLMDKALLNLEGLHSRGESAMVQAAAVPFQKSFRMLCHAWLHLWALSIVTPKLVKLAGAASGEKPSAAAKESAEAAFYYGKALSSRFYIGSEFRKFAGYLDQVMSPETAVADSFADLFTGMKEG